MKVVADGDKNGVYFVTAIGTEGENKAFANDGQVVKLGKDNDISSLLDSLSAETSAREIAISNLKSELSGAISAEQYRQALDRLNKEAGEMPKHVMSASEGFGLFAGKAM